MKKTLLKLLVVIAAFAFCSATGTVNAQQSETNYVTLYVVKDKPITFKLFMNAAGEVTVSTENETYRTFTTERGGWTDNYTVTPKEDYINVYGDYITFDCNGNGENIVGFDVSHATIRTFYGYNNAISEFDFSECPTIRAVAVDGNNLSTDAYNRMYCSLPQIEEQSSYNFIRVESSASAFLASNWNIAKNKNFSVQNNDKGGTEVTAECTSTYDCNTGLEDIEVNTFLVYPNPAKNSVTLDLSRFSADINQEITLINNAGQVIYKTLPFLTELNSQNTVSSDNLKSITIDISSLNEGVYYIKIGNTVKKFIKE